MADMRDGEVVCAGCRTPLNRTDLNCWRCGGTRLNPVGIEISALRRAGEGTDPKEGFAALSYKGTPVVSSPMNPSVGQGVSAPTTQTGPRASVPSTGGRKIHHQQVEDVRAWVDAGCQHRLVHCVGCARFVCPIVAGLALLCTTCRRNKGLPVFAGGCGHIGKAFELPPVP